MELFHPIYGRKPEADLIPINPNDTLFLDLANLVPGTYQFTISVADGEGLTANDIVNLQVREEDPLVKPGKTFSPDGKGDPSTETVAHQQCRLIG
jgi:hypothetical protein